MNETQETAEAGAVAFDNLNRQASKAGTTIAAALAAGQVEGRKLDDVLKDVGTRLGNLALRTAGSSLTSSLTSTLTQTLTSSLSSTALQSVGASTSASFGQLAGNADGNGAAYSLKPSNGQAARPMNITMNISTPNAESFRNSEAQVTAALARAVQRGQRSL
jgi:hypothetical protein